MNAPDAPAPVDLCPPAGRVVAVRTLCEFTARSGDLDLRYTPSPTGAEGVAGHGEVTGRRPAGYQRELRLSARYQPEGDTGEPLTVQGRADGFDPALSRVEEIKTHRGDAALIPENQRALHRAQAQLYGWMLCQQLDLARIEVVLVYFNIDTGEETPLAQWHEAAALRAFFDGLCARYWQWALSEEAHRRERDAALRGLPFPFDDFRSGQRQLTAGVFRCQRAGRHLLAQASTGIGKTVATLFAALRAAPAAGTDKLLYLTAKTPGRQLALDALARLRGTVGEAAAPLRVLERVARDKACEHPDKACHGESCPLARGFYDRLPAAREAAVRVQWLDKTGLRDVALQHSVCPYYLGQDLLRWSDVVVGDFNHFFDIGAHVHGLAVTEGWRVGLLVDEAHNLIERARQMYSASLDPAVFQALRATAPTALRPALDRLHRRWAALARSQTSAYEVLPEPPPTFLDGLQSTCAAIADHLAQQPAQQPAQPPDSALQAWYFDALHFQRVAERHGDHALCDLSRPADAVPSPGGRRSPARHPVISLRCLVPGPLLEERWKAAHSATLFSATLSPMDFVADMLGLPADTARLDVPSPFSPQQLSVHIDTQLSTRYADRASSLDGLVDRMAVQYHAQPGNYLAFFSSFDYLQQALQRLKARHPQLPAWAQSRSMSEPEREAFVARFQPDGAGIGFAVLGGAFGEGIDLPGRRLIGAFVATLGLPQVNPVNEQLRARLQARFGRGYDYAYLYPGLQKVVQAAGRVIRTEQDQGVVLLMDDRFARPEVRRLLPAWWNVSAGGP
ncbi:MAG: ATP-dependent DNA helicase [Hydrogenophaga sp.]|nr:ATP-dependent DNA helicase [Hydrogenophaga sp.]